MMNRIHPREVLAWITLALAFILFGATIAFSQTKTINVERDNGKVHLKIEKSVDGKTVKIDTTFEANDDTDINRIVEQLSEMKGMDLTGDVHYGNKNDKNGIRKNRMSMNFDMPALSDEQKEKLHADIEKSMKEMRKGLEEMKHSLQNMHIRIDNDSDNDNDFNFNFDMPDFDRHGKGCNGYSYSFSHSGDDEIDSLRDSDHIVIVGSKNEKTPELEKVITTKNGKQVFVFKRSGNSSESIKTKSSDKPDIQNIKAYPNPNDGKFTLKFEAGTKGDIQISLLDSESRIVFNDKLDDFDGTYSRELDLGPKSKGNYIIKITQDKKSVTRKIVVN